ncbi:MAG: 50S ribosomal protein L17 [Ignavibacteria bacterium]|nr:50S ribosomal protein L17 [Ignavibacteria bacterium]
MIHRNKGRKLKRTASHRKALISNLSVSLIMHKKIKTTLAKAKELRVWIEPIITKSRKALQTKDSKPEYGVHLRREVNGFLQDKGAVKMLFDEIAPKVINRNGGYTRVLKMGRRLGDGAELALIELVDYNLEQLKDETEAAQKDTKAKGKTKAKSTTAKTTKAAGKAPADKKTAGKTAKQKKTAEKTTETKKSTKGKKKEAAE